MNIAAAIKVQRVLDLTGERTVVVQDLITHFFVWERGCYQDYHWNDVVYGYGIFATKSLNEIRKDAVEIIL
jgi:hypothetical protein